MVIGVLFSGIFTGLVATLAGLSFGLPLWLALVLYPLVGTLGSVGFVGFMFGRESAPRVTGAQAFSTEYR